MKRLSFLLFVFSLTLVSCNTPPIEISTESTSPVPMDTVILSDTPKPTDIPKQPTSSVTMIATDAPTETPQITATQPLTELTKLPALASDQPIKITKITMIDSSYGWGIGNQDGSGDRILYTEDGGHSWDERTPQVPVTEIQNPDPHQAWAYFYDNQIAWAIILQEIQPPPINPPVVWHTSDSGQTWEASEPLPLSEAESFFIPNDFSFINVMQGWLLVHVDAGMSHDYSNLYATTDGGVRWQKLADPYGDGLQSLQNTGVSFSNSNLGWVTKDNLGVLPGALLEQTTNGGQSWEEIFLPAPDTFDWFNEISLCATSYPTFLENDKGIVLVNCQNMNEEYFTYTYLTSDTGKSWQSGRLPTPVKGLFFVDDRIGWAFGRDIYQSTDGGLSWVKMKTVNWDGQFSFIDERTGWAVASDDDATALVSTEDGGITWQLIETFVK